jgi:hypothetical protein
MGGVKFPHGETVVRLRLVTVPDDSGFGQDTQEWVEEPWEGVAFAPGQSVETLDDGSTRVATKATIYDRLGRTADVRDKFIARGVEYGVNGDASGMWASPFSGWQAGSVVALQAVSGG